MGEGTILLRVTAVECTGPHRLRVTFDDGVRVDVDLTDRLEGEIFEPLQDPDFFRQVFLNPETGTVEWPNGADLAPTFLKDQGVPLSEDGST